MHYCSSNKKRIRGRTMPRDCVSVFSFNGTIPRTSTVLSFITRHSLVRAKGEVFVLLYVFLFVRIFINDFSTTCGPIQAKFCIRAYSGSGCVYSPFGGWRHPAGGKRGKWNFRYNGSQWGIFAFWRFLSDISATRGRIHTKLYLCRDNCLPTCPSSCGVHRPLGAGELKTQKIGVSCIGQLPFLFFFQRCQCNVSLSVWQFIGRSKRHELLLERLT